MEPICPPLHLLAALIIQVMLALHQTRPSPAAADLVLVILPGAYFRLLEVVLMEVDLLAAVDPPAAPDWLHLVGLLPVALQPLHILVKI